MNELFKMLGRMMMVMLIFSMGMMVAIPFVAYKLTVAIYNKIKEHRHAKLERN